MVSLGGSEFGPEEIHWIERAGVTMELALLSNLDIVKFIDVSGLFPAFIIAIVTYLSIRVTKRFLDGFAEANTRYRLLSKQVSVFLQFITFVYWVYSILLNLNHFLIFLDLLG